MKTNQMRTDLFRACFRKGVSHHHLGFGKDSKAEEQESFMVGKGKASSVSWLEAVGIRGSWKWAKEAGILCDWLGAHIPLSLIGPKLEAWTKIRGAISY